MEVQKGFVDIHGHSFVGFAFTHLLSIALMPRLADIGGRKLYRPDVGMLDAYPNLQPILTNPIDWELIRENYDELVKYAAALKRGTADAEAILSRFTKSGPMHPVYKTAMDLGKVRQTIFLCEYLGSKELRQEIQEGLNVMSKNVYLLGLHFIPLWLPETQGFPARRGRPLFGQGDCRWHSVFFSPLPWPRSNAPPIRASASG